MANQEQLDILKQGVETWNDWRQQYEDIIPDLRWAKLSGYNLRNADLNEAHLNSADLSLANLIGADLTHATLRGAGMREADMREADLSDADLDNATLYNTNLSNAILYYANLNGIDLINVDLRGATLEGAKLSHINLESRLSPRTADLSHAIIGSTIFGDVDMRRLEGLDTVVHTGPSTIGIDTIYHSQGDIPEAFLKGAGVDDTFITYIRSLVGIPIEYYSCFISYSSKDEAFVRRLHADLQSRNVRCWFASEDLKWGARTRPSIDEAIRFHDKLLLVLSKNSVASGWVEHEVKTALAKEREEKRTVLFPVRVDRAVFESPFDWATEIRRERNIGDFTGWKNHDSYQKAFARLLRDLKAEA